MFESSTDAPRRFDYLGTCARLLVPAVVVLSSSRYFCTNIITFLQHLLRFVGDMFGC